MTWVQLGPNIEKKQKTDNIIGNLIKKVLDVKLLVPSIIKIMPIV